MIIVVHKSYFNIMIANDTILYYVTIQTCVGAMFLICDVNEYRKGLKEFGVSTLPNLIFSGRPPSLFF